jgi:MerR family transcriptional regulator/heat shock protein HspR
MNTDAVYVISVASELAGVHPQTLRIYEKKGLIRPGRTPGGSRRYSEADLARLRVIQALTEAGINLEGVRRILELEATIRQLSDQLAATRGELEQILDQAHLGRAALPDIVRPTLWELVVSEDD